MTRADWRVRVEPATFVWIALIAVLLFLAGREMFGTTAGLVAMALFVFDPTILANAPVAPSFTGPASMPNYAALSNAAITGFDGATGAGQTFAGQADDPFFADLRVFDRNGRGFFGDHRGRGVGIP